MAKRIDKQPLDKPSAGSTFKRPVGAFAAALIDQCGLRGYRHGGAAVSDKHCGFVVNLGGATCADVLALCDEVRAIVKEKTGYDLEKEIRVSVESIKEAVGKMDLSDRERTFRCRQVCGYECAGGYRFFLH